MSEKFTSPDASSDTSSSQSKFNCPKFSRLAAFMLAMAAMSGCDTRGNFGSDNDNDTTIDCGEPENFGRCDFDGDGFQGDEECNDFDETIYPGAPETPYDGIDQDCDGSDLIDVDNDGFGAEGVEGTDGVLGTDCDDVDPEVNPGAPEVCDGVDNDCDGGTDDEDPQGAVDAEEWGLDVDGDGFAETFNILSCFQPENEIVGEYEFAYVVLKGDCDDLNNTTFPGAPEACDGVDNDCNGVIDEECEQ